MSVVEFYNEYYMRAEASKAHGLFCERVYGRNLCQHGMADMAQIEALLSFLGIHDGDRVLDLGCGNGQITEYMQKRTNAWLSGIDVSPVAIAKAIDRTQSGAERLAFRVDDMRSLHIAPQSFDAIVMIDSHYFVDDLEGLLDRLMLILRSGGRIGLFSDEGRGIAGCDDSHLDARESKIGQLLARRGITYSALDLSQPNREHWRRKEQVLRELRSEFEREGNLFLYENRLHECTSSNRDLDCRFLFHILKAH